MAIFSCAGAQTCLKFPCVSWATDFLWTGAVPLILTVVQQEEMQQVKLGAEGSYISIPLPLSLSKGEMLKS